MVIVDTDVIISSIRGNQIADQLMKKYLREASISVVTEMELYVGATSKSKKEIVAKVLQTHSVIPLNKAICEIAVRLVKTYNSSQRSLFLADALIAATSLHEECRLLTFNVEDFKFIKGLQLAK